MIIFNEFIWRKDHHAFHITDTKSMNNICIKGLIPMCGERSKLVDDEIQAIYFFDNINSVSDWIDILYKNNDIYELELLRFNLKNRKWIKQNDDEFYLPNKILPEKIEYLRIYDTENNNYLPLNYIDDNKLLIWNNINEYKPLIKNNTSPFSNK